MNRYYIEIDSEKFKQTGEVEPISPPVSWLELFDSTVGTGPKGNFFISRKEPLGNFVRVVGGSHGAVAEYLIRRKDGRNGLIITNRELSAATGVSLATTNLLLQRLQAADCIRCRTGALMVNPGISHKGTREREAFLLKLYENFENNTTIQIH